MEFSGRGVLGVCSVLLCAAVAVACGGGSELIGAKSITKRVLVAGDDQGDSGTYGFKFTVQNTDGSEPFPIFTELVAASVLAAPVCNRYAGVNTSIVFTTNEGCTSYAIAGSRINYQPSLATNLRELPVIGQVVNGAVPVQSPIDQALSILPGLGTVLANVPLLPLVGGAVSGVVMPIAQAIPGTSGSGSPLSIPKQLQDMGDAGINADDVVIIVAATNDASDLAAAYIQSDLDGGIAFSTLVGSLGVTTTDRQSAGLAYMEKLADILYDSISANILAKGGKGVVVFNLLDITMSPRLAQAQQTIAGAKEKAPTISQWVDRYNAQLSKRRAGDKRIIALDFHKLVHDAFTDKNLLISNVDTPVCPVTGKGTLDRLPQYDLKNCKSSELSARPPAGQSGRDWWNRYFFADSVHPTPYLHDLLARAVNLELIRAGVL